MCKSNDLPPAAQYSAASKQQPQFLPTPVLQLSVTVHCTSSSLVPAASPGLAPPPARSGGGPDGCSAGTAEQLRRASNAGPLLSDSSARAP